MESVVPLGWRIHEAATEDSFMMRNKTGRQTFSFGVRWGFSFMRHWFSLHFGARKISMNKPWFYDVLWTSPLRLSDHHTELICFQVEYDYGKCYAFYFWASLAGEWCVCMSDFFCNFFAHIHPPRWRELDCVTAAGCNGSSTHSSHELIGYRRDDLKLNKTAVRFEKLLRTLKQIGSGDSVSGYGICFA